MIDNKLSANTFFLHFYHFTVIHYQHIFLDITFDGYKCSVIKLSHKLIFNSTLGHCET
jgi:hypothetical protein